jgi:hypothetical protein
MIAMAKEQTKKESDVVGPPGRPKAVKDVPPGDEQLEAKRTALRKRKAAAGTNGSK